MEAKAEDLDGGKERRGKRHRDDGDKDEDKKRHRKNDLERMEVDSRECDFKERGKRDRRHGSKEGGKRDRRHRSKEGGKRDTRDEKLKDSKRKSREDDKHHHCRDRRSDKGNVKGSDTDNRKHNGNRVRDQFESFKMKEQYGTGSGSGSSWRRREKADDKYIYSSRDGDDEDQSKVLVRMEQHDTVSGSGWRRDKVDDEYIDGNRNGGDRDQFEGSRNKGIAIANDDLENWNGDPWYMKQKGVFSRNNSDLERWVPTCGSDEESLYRARSDKEGSRLTDKTRYLESDKPSRKRHREEEAKIDKKKRNSAWLVEEDTEKQQRSPVTLSDVEFSTEFDGRIVNREFKVAWDYRPLKPRWT